MNDLRLYVKGNIAQLYVNQELYQEVTLNIGNLTYTSLVLMEVSSNTKIHAIQGSNLQSAKDCAGTVGGSAYVDSCGNCVGGETGKTACTLDLKEELLHLIGYSEGDMLGENLIVGMDQDIQANWINGNGGDGIVTVKETTTLPDQTKTDMRLSDEFELSFRILPKSSNDTYIFLVSGENHIELKFNCCGVSLNGTGGGDSWRNYDVNDLKLYVKGNVAKLYVNDVFYQKDILDNGSLTYTSAVLMEVPLDTKIYELNVRKIQSVRDCAGTVGGSAYVDSCGNCVGGETNKAACALDLEEELLYLSGYSAGDVLGENLIVGTDQYTQTNWINGNGGDGILTVRETTTLPDQTKADMRLSDEFELSFRILPKSSNDTYIFLVSGENHIELKFNCCGVSLNGTGGGDSWRNYDVNDLRLYVKGNVAKLYVNDVFYQKDILDNGSLTYTSAVLMEVPLDTKIYELNVKKIQSVRDCAGTIGGSAYVDSCGNCVSGDTNKAACTLGFEKDFLKLSDYSEGTLLSDNLIIGMDGDTQMKWITGQAGNGNLTIENNVNLSDEFEFSARVLPKSSNDTYIFLVSGENHIELKFNCCGVRLNGTGGSFSWRNYDINYLRLYVKGNVAKLYVNDVFYQKDILDNGNLTYSKITVKDLPLNQYLYSLTGRTFGSSSGHAVNSFLPALLFLLQ